MDGSSNPHDVLRILGDKELAKYLVDEIQEVYRLQGCQDKNDKHIEVIVRQMLKRVKIKDVETRSSLHMSVGGKGNLRGDKPRMLAEDKKMIGESLLLGDYKGFPEHDSFVSAARSRRPRES